MKTFSVNCNRKFPGLLFILILSFIGWSCSRAPLKHERVDEHWAPALRERSRQLKKLTNISGSGQVSFSGTAGNGTIYFDFEYRTADTLNLWIKDPIGRKLANLELGGDTYHLHLIRDGRYFSGTQLETDQLPISGGPITPALIRRILLAAPFESTTDETAYLSNETKDETPVLYYKFKHGQNEPVGLNWLYKGQQLVVVYNKYADIADFKIPSQIMIKDKSEEIAIAIHFSHFKAELLKFQT
ncbi:MAG TPA: hypothetical protein P5268_06005 [Candidatus Marinimicrobia bacterium]|nr:hypothetical protein [Candidatus Neomarinimicrobiota bacterium]HRS51059.1 hypothetical protein [Candidatus Neomarinimicrobiota bacterium]HRU92566.1 hypothetical protein [Candidatus Neomarinimicrobiota bacterium]